MKRLVLHFLAPALLIALSVATTSGRTKLRRSRESCARQHDHHCREVPRCRLLYAPRRWPRQPRYRQPPGLLRSARLDEAHPHFVHPLRSLAPG